MRFHIQLRHDTADTNQGKAAIELVAHVCAILWPKDAKNWTTRIFPQLRPDARAHLPQTDSLPKSVPMTFTVRLVNRYVRPVVPRVHDAILDSHTHKHRGDIEEVNNMAARVQFLDVAKGVRGAVATVSFKSLHLIEDPPEHWIDGVNVWWIS